MTSIIHSIGKDRCWLITSGKRERTQGQSNYRKKIKTLIRWILRRFKKICYGRGKVISTTVQERNYEKLKTLTRAETQHTLFGI